MVLISVSLGNQSPGYTARLRASAYVVTGTQCTYPWMARLSLPG